MDQPRTIVITGASSGIGAALARAYAAPDMVLALTGRDAQRLEETAEACRRKNATVETATVDVTDAPAMERWLKDLDARQPVDLVIANAGVSEDRVTLDTLADATARTFAINVQGVFNTILPLLPAMKQRGRGQVAINASLAGYRGLPTAVPYSASKAAVKSYGEALRGAVARHGIAVTVVCPGFVASRITDKNRFPMPFMMTADRAAGIIRQGLTKNRGVIAFPWPTFAAVRLMTLLPAALVDRLLRRK
ncbi:short-chain dehydrogenase [Rhodothalassium salexigens]|uniref:SDR family NAD(P)-dependent oxidoreductase n=1 Tax=Rhodothalassium salexigens TaxID=1086 RepID=UPI001913F34E|nr:SDR family NAD(P)-dependent oxidoreductase [Rhodothalassium salexigens]MBK5911590.1 short-chain dehydrogenase [Rhodothalassium salexigens]